MTDPTISEQARLLAWSEWIPADTGESDGPLGLFVLFIFIALKVRWLVGVFSRKSEDRDAAYVRFHGTQASALLALYVASGFLTCCLGWVFLFPVLAVMAMAGSRAARAGTWLRLPLVGLLVRAPASP